MPREGRLEGLARAGPRFDALVAAPAARAMDRSDVAPATLSARLRMRGARRSSAAGHEEGREDQSRKSAEEEEVLHVRQRSMPNTVRNHTGP